MTVEERLEAIAKSGWMVAWDGCHKIYLLTSPKAISAASAYEYRIYPADEIKQMWEGSCSLRFINNWGLDTDEGFDHELQIAQFEEVDDDNPGGGLGAWSGD